MYIYSYSFGLHTHIAIHRRETASPQEDSGPPDAKGALRGLEAKTKHLETDLKTVRREHGTGQTGLHCHADII